MAICLIGLGSNLGDRAGYLSQALDLIREHPAIGLLRVSSFVVTAPVGGPPGQGNYLNGAALVETDLPPAALLKELLGVENRLGRVRNERFGPRTIDLDLLLYDQSELSSPDLTLPHPQLAARRFVLEPAVEIAPGLVHPKLQATLAELLVRLTAEAESGIGMRVVTSPERMRKITSELRARGKRVGLVPTMGALHVGHLSLVRIAREEADAVVATIFVNPTQFGPSEDFAQYPRTLEADLQALSAARCDYVFVPTREAMYPPGCTTLVEPSRVAEPLEGVFRPGHFQGVATVVLKLFHIIPADLACFGRKDFQQALVIRRMVDDLKLPIKIVDCPIVREADGLALSSRNRYLSPAERQQALALSRSLDLAEQMVREGERQSKNILAAMRKTLAAAGIERIDYIALADPETLAEKHLIEETAVALLACHVGKTRLIDNRLLTVRA